MEKTLLHGNEEFMALTSHENLGQITNLPDSQFHLLQMVIVAYIFSIRLTFFLNKDKISPSPHKNSVYTKMS